MRRTISCIFAILSILAVKAQFSVGIHDSRYVYGTYSPVDNLDLTLQHSLYSEKFAFQRIELAAGYGMPFASMFHWHTGIYGATTWNGNYQVVGAHASLSFDYRRIGISGRIQPIYDSGLKYMTTYAFSARAKIISNIDLLAAYTTIPEFRESEKRLRGGFEFKVNRLKVSPQLSFSLEQSSRFKNMRVLMSMNYDF